MAVLDDGASIICFSTVPPSFMESLQKRLNALGKNIGVSGQNPPGLVAKTIP
jgi:hypothetical protein